MTDLDIDAIARRSRQRVLSAIDEPQLTCPFCGRAMAVRRTVLGWIEEDGERAHIDGVQAKCAGAGCGFRPDFDVPLRDGRGVWPALTDREEFERELDLRDGARAVDMALDAGAGGEPSVRDRLEALGYR